MFNLKRIGIVVVLLVVTVAGVHALAQSTAKTIYYHDKVVVLLYHNFQQKERGTAITHARFEQHMAMLKEKGFNVISMKQVHAFLSGKGNVPSNAIAITLDDGYLSNDLVALPVLKQYKYPALIFVPITNIGRVESLQDKKSIYLTWEEMQSMQKQGISFGSHTYNGHFCVEGLDGKLKPWLVARMLGESQADYEKRVLSDLSSSKVLLEKNLNAKIEDLAFPYGVYNADVMRLAKQAGFEYQWTTKHWAVAKNSDVEQLGRVSVGIGGTTPDILYKKIMETAKAVSPVR